MSHIVIYFAVGWANFLPMRTFLRNPNGWGIPVATGDSTVVECILQIDLFMQNKAKFTKYPNGLKTNYIKGLYQFSAL